MTFDICIRGAGIVGRTLALLLAEQRLKVGLVQSEPPAGTTPKPATQDIRAYSLNAASQSVLKRVRAWPNQNARTPVLGIRVFDGDTSLHFPAPSRPSTSQSPLSWIVGADTLLRLLEQACEFQPNITTLSSPAAARLQVACEGKDSVSRSQWGVEFHRQDYPQSAIATQLVLTTPHQFLARQWFVGEHIIAVLPMGGMTTDSASPQASGHEAALVWSCPHSQAEQIMGLSDADCIAKLHSLLPNETFEGRTYSAPLISRLASPRQMWPLRLGYAKRWVGVIAPSHDQDSKTQPTAHFALAGDAAHTIHPLAGQGLNLGLADARDLALCIEKRDYWREVHDLKVLRQYARMRAAPTQVMAQGCDWLQSLFAQSHPLIQKMRQWGMSSLNHLPALNARLIHLASQ